MGEEAKVRPGDRLAGGAMAPGRRGRVKSSDLFGAEREIIIEHAGTEYVLRVTSLNKLILTK